MFNEIRSVSSNELHYLLHNSTIDAENIHYATYVETINSGDMIAKWELWQLLQMSQRTPFIDYDQFTNKEINDRLTWIMKSV